MQRPIFGWLRTFRGGATPSNAPAMVLRLAIQLYPLQPEQDPESFRISETSWRVDREEFWLVWLDRAGDQWWRTFGEWADKSVLQWN